MPDQGPDAAPTPGLTSAEANRRKAILGRLQDALDAGPISSALVGRRTLILRSEQTPEHSPGYKETIRPSDPQLYIFAAGDTHVVTTDGNVYWFADGYAYPASDPAGAALICARWHRPRGPVTGRR
jgi:hypothetical protein